MWKPIKTFIQNRYKKITILFKNKLTNQVIKTLIKKKKHTDRG